MSLRPRGHPPPHLSAALRAGQGLDGRSEHLEGFDSVSRSGGSILATKLHEDVSRLVGRRYLVWVEGPESEIAGAWSSKCRAWPAG